MDWPYQTRVVFNGPGYDAILKPIFPRGTPKLGPDGAIWVSAFSGEGHLDPENGQYSPYYSAELFRSEPLAPGATLSEIKLNKALQPGSYEAIATTAIYADDGAYLFANRIPVTLNVAAE